MRFLAISIFSLLFLVHSIAQVSHGGKPLGLSGSNLKSAKMLEVRMPELQASLKSNYVDLDLTRYKTLKFAQTFPVQLNPDNSGKWSTLSDGSRVWRLLISSEGARSLNIIFSKYRLPDGARLFLYSPSMNHVLGSFTSANNKKSGVLPVLPIEGDQLVVEYIEPFDVDFSGELEIGSVNHDYIGVYRAIEAAAVGNFGSSQDCEVDVSCDTGWEDQRRSIVKMIIDGNELCTGTLVNNIKQNGDPYILTAAHCYKDHAFNASGTIFIFNYEVPNCYATIEGSREQSVAGGILRAWSEQSEYKNSDYALVEMSIKPPEAYRPYYAGWDATLSSESNVLSIHHPNGDVKKISHDEDTIKVATLVVDGFNYKPSAHWRIFDWESGVTEGGSSGCPLFNQSGYIIGGLSAGQASCNNPINDFYFNLKEVWTSHPDPAKTLKNWLDPLNTGVRKLEGIYPDPYKEIYRITNIEEGETVEVVKLGSSGYLTGFNNMGITSFAERFLFEDTCRLYGFYFVPFTGNVSSSVSMEFKVWEGGTVPGNELWSKQVNIKEWIRTQTVGSNYGKSGGYFTKNNYKEKENFLHIPEELFPGNDFYVGFEIVPNGPADSFAIYQVSDRGLNGKNTAYYKQDNNWKTYPNFNISPQNTSLFMDAVVKVFKNSSDTTLPTLADKIVRYIEPYPAIGESFTFYFSEPLDNNAFLSLYTLNGIKIGEWIIPFGSSSYETNLANVSRGIYLVRIRLNEKTELHRLVNLVP